MGCRCENCGGKMTGLAHIGVIVKDIDASIKFYSDALGFELTARQSMETAQLAFLNAGSCRIELVQTAAYAPRSAGVVDHIAIEVEDIETLVCKLIEKGIVFLSDINTTNELLGGIKNVFFTGPDGERLEFFEYISK
jgi:lactoylglutathione lyase